MQEFQMVVRINESMFRHRTCSQIWVDTLIRQYTHRYECRITDLEKG